MNTNSEVKLIKYQERATITYEIVLIVSFLLLYDKEKKRENKKGIFKNKTSSTIALINRGIILIICIVFLYSNYENLKLSKQKNKDTSSLELQLFGSTLVLISALIAIYITIKDYGKNSLSEYENPEV